MLFNQRVLLLKKTVLLQSDDLFLGDKQVVCHMCDKSQFKRGFCDIATCLMKNTLSLCKKKDVREIIYYSEFCGWQKRNKFVTASLLYTLSQFNNLNIISEKFLQSGHSQIECNSVHSTIKCAKKYNRIIQFKDFGKKYCTNVKVSLNRQKINWLLVGGCKWEGRHLGLF